MTLVCVDMLGEPWFFTTEMQPLLALKNPLLQIYRFTSAEHYFLLLLRAEAYHAQNLAAQKLWGPLPQTQASGFVHPEPERDIEDL